VFGMRPVGVVHVPGQARQHGRIGETKVAIGLRGRGLLRAESRGGNPGGGQFEKSLASHGRLRDDLTAGVVAQALACPKCLS